MEQHTIESPIVPIRIPTPFAVGDVYSYLIRDEKIVLVDCGYQSDSSYERIRQALKEQGLDVIDIDEIWLTHGHPDHFGQAARLAESSDATIRGHSKERNNFAGNRDRRLFREFFERHKISADTISMMLDQLDWLQQYQVPINPQPITEGDKLTTGELHFTVKHTPGHAPGHVVFYDDKRLFGGDVLLEHISTNALINFDPDSGKRNQSLIQYRRSLQWIKRQEGLVLPGHGKKIIDIKRTAHHHLTEHNKRYKRIKELLAERPCSLMELSKMLFPDALKNKAHFLVFSEIIGYLDWGMAENSISQNEMMFYLDK